MLLFLMAPAFAGGLMGVAWVPTGIGALSWQDAGVFSDTLVGEFDGWLRPPLTVHGGWVGQRFAALGGVSYVGFSNSTFNNASSVDAVGGLRLSGDGRYYLHPRVANQTNGWLDVGAYGVIPSSRTVSDAYTAEEQADADEGAKAERARIGGVGAQAGVGAEYLFGDHRQEPAVALGFRYVIRAFRGQESSEEGYRISTVWLSEAALVLEFQL